MQFPWSELTDQVAEILVEDEIERAADKGIRLDRVALHMAAKVRAAELVETEVIPVTRQIVQDLTLSAIDGNADAGEPRERIMKSPAFSEARARMLARIAVDGKQRA